MKKINPFLKTFPLWAGYISILTGIVVLYGWHYHIEVIKTILPGAVSMKPNAALAFILIGFSQLAVIHPAKQAKYVTIICSSLTIAIGLFSLLHLFFNLDLGIESFIYRETSSTHGTIYPGVMSLNTAINFIFLGIIFILMAQRKQTFVIQFCIVYILSISVFVLLGYAAHLEQLVGSISFAKMPFHTALLFVLLCGGIFASVSKGNYLFETVEQKLFTGFAFSVAIVLYIFLLSASELVPVYFERNTFDTIRAKVSELKSLQSDLAAIENNLEQHIFTGDPKSLHNQLEQIERFDTHFNDIIRKDAGSPYYQKIARISQMMLGDAKKVNESLYSNSAIDAHSLLVIQSLINQAHDLISFVIERHLATLASINELKIQNYKTTSIIRIIGILLQISLISFLFIYTKNNIERRRKAEELYKNVNAQLENRVVEQQQIIGYSEKRYRAVAENTPLAICNTLEDATIVFANQTCVDLTEHDSIDEFYKKGKWPFFVRDDAFTEFRRKLTTVGYVKDIELTGLTNKSNVKKLSVTAWIDHEIIYHIITDITERKITEDRLISTNILLSYLVEVNKLISTTGNDTELLTKACESAVRVAKFTSAWFGKYDRTSKTIIPTIFEGTLLSVPEKISILAGTGPTEWAFVSKSIEEKRNKIISTTTPESAYSTGGDEVCFSASFPIVVDGVIFGCLCLHSAHTRVFDNDHITLLEKIAADIESALDQIRIKSLQHEIELSRKKLAIAVEQSPVSVVITDHEGKIEYVNQKFCSVSQYSRSEVIGKTQGFIKSGYHDNTFYKNLWDIILSGKPYRGEILNKKKNGDVFWESVLISPLKNEKGVITNFVSVKEDITDYKKMIDELTAAKEKAEEMNRLKSNFLANMSHELRTPLIGIIGFSEMIAAESSDREIAEMASTITESGDRLKNTLNMILDLSRIGSEQRELNSQILNTVPLIKQCIAKHTHAAHQKGLVIQQTSESEYMPGFIDEQLFTDALNNILKNAIIYTHQGYIAVRSSIDGSGEVKHITIDVTDTGIGIAEKDYEHIFEEFRQASEGLSRSFEGTGLGLTLAKKYIEWMGGTISLTSKLGGGSTFSIKIPLVQGVGPGTEENTIISAASQAPDSTKSVLYIEDDVISQKVVSKMLQNYFTIDLARSSTDALKKITAKNYQCLLMDINLGESINGAELTREIRKIQEYKEVPIVAITAYARPNDRENFLAAGCTDYISKPFSQAELMNTLNRVLHN